MSTDIGIRKVALDLLRNILKPLPYGRHPVDTGRARAGWYMSVKGLGLNFNFDRGVKKKKNQVSMGMKEGSFIDATKNRFDKFVMLINGVNYIVFLEYGHSGQAPAGMVRISMRKMRGALPRELSRSFIRDWNKFRVR